MKLSDYKDYTEIITCNGDPQYLEYHSLSGHIPYQEVLKLYPHTSSFSHTTHGEIKITYMIIFQQPVAIHPIKFHIQ